MSDSAAGRLLSPLTRIGRNASWLLAGEVIVKLALLAIAFLVSRHLGAAAMGAFTLAYAGMLLLVVLTACGQVEVLMRAVAVAPRQAGSLLAASERLQRRVTWLAAPVALAALLVFQDRTLRYTWAGFLLYALLRRHLFTRGGLFKGLDRADVEVKARAIEMLAALALVGAVVACALPVWWTGAALAAGAAAALAWMRPRVQALDAEPATPVGLLTESLPFLGISLATQLLLRADSFLLEAFDVSRAAIGAYGIAGTLVWGALTLPQLLALAAYPTLSRQAAAGRSPRKAALAVTAVGLATCVPVSLALTALAPWITRLAFTAPPDGAARLLTTLAWALPPAGVSMLLGIVLAAWHRQRAALACQAVAIATALALNLLWIPQLGALGAARAAIVAQAALAALQAVLAMWGQSAAGEVRPAAL